MGKSKWLHRLGSQSPQWGLVASGILGHGAFIPASPQKCKGARAASTSAQLPSLLGFKFSELGCMQPAVLYIAPAPDIEADTMLDY